MVYAEVKKELRPYHLGQLEILAQKYTPLMVIAETIFPTLKEELRKKEIGYLDGAGNLFLQTNNIYVWMDGNKPVKAATTTTNRAFTKTGLRVVFYFMLTPEAINFTYRKIADATGIALGNVRNIIEGLREAGHILQVTKKEMKLVDKRELLERWITGYRETLKPTLLLGEYNMANPEGLRDWQSLATDLGETYWGGEPGADYLTNYLTPAELTIYTTQDKVYLMKKWRLVPAKHGRIKIYKKFWEDHTTEDKLYAPPLLIFADLIITNDPRCAEVAEMVYEKYLLHFDRN
jgi:hypothetical protein